MLFVLGLVGGSVAAANANEFVGAVSPDDVLRMLNDNGYADANIAETDDEDLPIIHFTLADSTGRVYFYECGSIGKVCELLQLKVMFEVADRPSLKVINEFNAAQRFSQAYIDGRDDLVIEQWLTLEGGISETNFIYSVVSFERIVGRFEDLIAEREPRR